MAADFPWFNEVLGGIFGRDSDITPYPYKVFYMNLNIGSTYFLALCIISLLLICKFILPKILNEEHTLKTKSMTEFLYSFFIFGIIFASCLSLHGAIINPSSTLSLNSFFYIIGIALFLLILTLICKDSYLNFR